MLVVFPLKTTTSARSPSSLQHCDSAVFTGMDSTAPADTQPNPEATKRCTLPVFDAQQKKRCRVPEEYQQEPLNCDSIEDLKGLQVASEKALVAKQLELDRAEAHLQTQQEHNQTKLELEHAKGYQEGLSLIHI